jgi:LacI family transcriptional regulator/LacI family purine nucleotide synthesis repressor
MTLKQNKKRRVTLQTVADVAAVNRVTAAVALGRSPNGGTRVSEATRLRVIEAAQQLGYAPNAIARALRGERTNIIGYYAGYEALDAHSPFTAAILQGLQRSCYTHHQDLMLFGSFERDTVESIYATLTSGKIDGLVLLPTPRSPIMDMLFDSHLSVVAIANTHPAIPSVVVDDVAGSTMLAEYLAQKGHRRILYRTPEEKRTSTVRRLEAFLAAVSGLGISVTVSYENDAHVLSAQEIALLSESPARRPTAAVCWMDLSAYTLLDQCERLGLRVPEDLAIVGFDGVALRIKPKYALTTIRAPWFDVAVRAVDYLLALLDGHEVPQETILPVELVVGDTA